MKRGTPRHPKMQDLCEILQINLPLAVGYLELLWHFTSQFTPQGDIGRYTDRRIEAAVDWDGEPGKLVEALTQSGWLERNSAHRLIVHDWHDHADDATRKRLSRANLDFLSLASKVTGHRPEMSGPPEPVPEPVPEPTPEPRRRRATSAPPRESSVRSSATNGIPRNARRRGTGNEPVTPADGGLAATPDDAEFASMREALIEYMGGRLPEPDDELVRKCLEAGRGASAENIWRFLVGLYKSEQSPRHANGPKGWGWFPVVIARAFKPRRGGGP